MTVFDNFKKRTLDLLIAVPALILSAPIIILSAMIARVDTAASGFYLQERVGRNGKIFKVIKLRTMFPLVGSSITSSGDPRITPSGKIFRKYKLDELPQLVNVVLGQMSIVGPRPDVPGYADKLTGLDRRLLNLRPGITGPASLKYRNEEEILSQVMDPKAYNDDVIWPDKVKINLDYHDNWNIVDDLRLIRATIVNVFGRSTNSDNELKFTPLIIVGAGRSGTNALRDMLTHLEKFGTWPCDEIDAIWRYGNTSKAYDYFDVKDVNQKNKKFIRNAFQKEWRRNHFPKYIVEKTCANSLRVEFVEGILPEAKYLFIVRNASDVASSAAIRWSGKLELPFLRYYLAKVRYVPLSDIRHYIERFLRNRFKLLFGGTKRFESWGPRVAAFKKSKDLNITEIAALQWADCVSHSAKALDCLPRTKVLIIKYEDLSNNPRHTLERILSFLGEPVEASEIVRASSIVNSNSIGKGKNVIESLSHDVQLAVQKAEAELDKLMHTHVPEEKI